MLLSITVNRCFMHIRACILIVIRFLRFCKEFLGIPLKIYGTLKPIFCYFKPTCVQSLSYFQNSSNLYFSIYFKKLYPSKLLIFIKLINLCTCTSFSKPPILLNMYFVNLLFCDIDLLIAEMHD